MLTNISDNNSHYNNQFLFRFFLQEMYKDSRVKVDDLLNPEHPTNVQFLKDWAEKITPEIEKKIVGEFESLSLHISAFTVENPFESDFEFDFEFSEDIWEFASDLEHYWIDFYTKFKSAIPIYQLNNKHYDISLRFIIGKYLPGYNNEDQSGSKLNQKYMPDELTRSISYLVERCNSYIMDILKRQYIASNSAEGSKNLYVEKIENIIEQFDFPFATVQNYEFNEGFSYLRIVSNKKTDLSSKLVTVQISDESEDGTQLFKTSLDNVKACLVDEGNSNFSLDSKSTLNQIFSNSELYDKASSDDYDFVNFGSSSNGVVAFSRFDSEEVKQVEENDTKLSHNLSVKSLGSGKYTCLLHRVPRLDKQTGKTVVLVRTTSKPASEVAFLVSLDDTLEVLASSITQRFKFANESDLDSQLTFAGHHIIKEFTYDNKIQDVLTKYNTTVSGASHGLHFTIENSTLVSAHETLNKNKEIIVKGDLGRAIESLTVTYQGVERPIQIKSYPDLLSVKSTTHTNVWSDITSLTLRGTFWSEELLNAQHQGYSLFGFKVINTDTKEASSFFWNRQLQKFVDLDCKNELATLPEKRIHNLEEVFYCKKEIFTAEKTAK